MSQVQAGLQFTAEEAGDVQPDIYCANDLQFIHIDDSNTYNYANGWVNFTSLALTGGEAGTFLDIANGYLAVPLTVSASAVGGSFTVDGTALAAENAAMISCKGVHHLIDFCGIQLGGVNLNRQSNYQNFMTNIKLLSMGQPESEIIGDVMGFYPDSASSYSYDANVLETNNNLLGYSSLKALSPASYQNEGMFKRVKGVLDTVSASSNFTTANKIFTTQTLQDNMGNYLYSAATGKYVWQLTALIPIKYLHESLANMPPMASLKGFNIRLQLNAGSNITSTVTLANGATMAQTPGALYPGYTSVATTQAWGNTFPWMLAKPGVNAGTGCSVFGTATNSTPAITISSSIGWLNGGTQPNGLACRLWIPQVRYTPDYGKMLLSRQPKCRVKYTDYYVEPVTGLVGGSNFSRLYNSQIGKPRWCYILPYFNPAMASTPANAVSPYLSPLSSAPTSVSLCRLKNLQVQIGGRNLFFEAQQFTNQFYQNLLPALARANGNTFAKNDAFSGLIKKSDWERGPYNIYAINLLKGMNDEIGDNDLKSFQIGFSIDTNAGTTQYDYLIIIEYECSDIFIDISTGMLATDQGTASA